MDQVKIIPLGGLGEFGLNMMAIESRDSMVIVDTGLMFPDDSMLGIDLVIPDISYLVANRSQVKGIFLTHGHEDHIGALPYVLKELPVPVYGTPLTLAFVRERLSEHKLTDAAHLIPFRARDAVEIGPFRVEGVQVTHSIADSLALGITTPAGLIVHTGDFKVDHTPVDGRSFDLSRFSEWGEKGVMLLLSDSTNAEIEGTTPSESAVFRYLERIFHKSHGKIFISFFSSNIHRMQLVMDLAKEFGRKVAAVGRSMVSNASIASELGHLHIPSGTLVEVEELVNAPSDHVVLLTSGSQGEPLSALTRIATNGHRTISIDPGDTVILSARIIPGNEKKIHQLINQLYRQGAEVYYEPISRVHVSGHGSQEELKLVLNATRPRFFVPIHGEYRQLVKHIELAQQVGLPSHHCLLTENGQVVVANSRGCQRKGEVSSGRVFVDGKGVGNVGSLVLRDRRHLSEDGMVLAVVALNGQTGEILSSPDLLSHGLTDKEDNKEILSGAKKIVLETLESLQPGMRKNRAEVQEEVQIALRRYFQKTLKRRPVVLPCIMEM
jgi:ribonuclease J